MRVLLRERGSLLYFKQSGEWVQNESEAADFKTVQKAKDFLNGRQRIHADIVVRFGDETECARA